MEECDTNTLPTMNNNAENVLVPLPENRPSSRNVNRNWCSPPQPHMCVQDTLKNTKITCFINVMSWCKIGIPLQPALIPLYGGVRVPLSDKLFKDGPEKPLVFAVMVNPEILKNSGKMAPNPQDRDDLIDLMLDFVETMNENIKFSRNFTVLKDRDLTGELKDIWAVIQAKREAEKNNSTNNSSLPDENSRPCPQDLDSAHQNTNHKRLTFNMVRHGKTRFQDHWLLDPDCKNWLRRAAGDVYSATCIFCPGAVISVSTMGRQALVSHSRSKKHMSKANAEMKQPNIGAYLRTEVRESELATTSKSSVMNENLPSTSKSSMINESGPNLPQPEQASLPLSSVPNHHGPNNPQLDVVPMLVNKKNSIMNKFILNETVSRAEIIWCLNSVFSHRSNRATAKDIHILRHMFPENEVLSKMQLEWTKVGYVAVFGLAPFFKNELLKELNQSSHLVVSFDESLNKISQSQQMDIVVRFWSAEKNEVCTRYLTSAFLKKTTAADLLRAFIAALNCVELKKVIQVSMDGPNVNKKFLLDLKDYLKTDLSLETKMIDLGTCGLHTLHCAFKASMNTTGWNIVPFLRALYNFFKDQPARRGSFTKHTGSTKFPQKFCAVRWLENAGVAERAINLLPDLRKYVQSLDQAKSKPSTKSFSIIEECLKNHLLGAQLAFFKTLSSDLQPLLTEFQSNLPLAPFLYTCLKNLVMKEMERFVLPDKVSPSIKAFSKSENLLPVSKINVGIGAKCEIGKCHNKISMKEVTLFKDDCQKALKCLLERLLDRSPLVYETTRYLTSLDPNIAHTKVGQDRFEKLIILLTQNNLVNTQTAERAQEEFKTLCTNKDVIQQMKNFKRVEDVEERSGCQKMEHRRLDHFWIRLVRKHCSDYRSLESIIKLVLILSHGNAEVERGFSINKECLIENMNEESLVAARTICNAVNVYGGVEKVPICKKMLLSVSNAHSKYKEHLQEEKKKTCQETAEKENRKRNQILVRELELKKRKIIEDAEKECESIVHEIENLVK